MKSNDKRYSQYYFICRKKKKFHAVRINALMYKYNYFDGLILIYIILNNDYNTVIN